MLDISEKQKELFRGRYLPRNIRVHFPDGERPDLTKKDIYGDGSSFSFTESLCSQRNIKFGIAEKSVLKFDAIGLENIAGSTIEASCEITDPDTGETISIPYGKFEVDSCQKQSDMRRRKVVAYSGTRLEISPLTMAKLSLPSLNTYPYRMDIEELTGTGDRQRDRFTSSGQIRQSEFTCSMQGKDFDIMTMGVSCTGSDGLRYIIYCDITYAYKTVDMIAAIWRLEPLGEKWYDIRSEITDNDKARKWDDGIAEINAYLDMLRNIVIYQTEGTRNALDSFLQKCDAYMTGCTVRMDVRQTYNKKKLSTRKEVKITMDDMGNGVRRSRYVSSILLDVLNARGGQVGNVITNDTVAEGTLTFMCPQSVEVRIETQLDDQPSETVFDRFIVSGRKETLVGYGRMDIRYTMPVESAEDGVNHPAEYTTPLPYVMFERKEGDDGYFRCADVEKNVQSAVGAMAEIQAKFVHMDRYGVLRFVGISDHFGLYPEETLYPSEDLYPEESNGGLLATCEYSSLWSEDYEVQQFGTVIVSYKNMSGNDEVLVYRFNRANRNIYQMKDNFVFKTGGWKPAEIRDILDTWFIPNLKGIRYIPAELEMVGLPYMEAGDVLSVLTRTGGIEVFVFRRTLKGINFMTDSVEARGDEVNKTDMDDSVTVVEEG